MTVLLLLLLYEQNITLQDMRGNAMKFPFTCSKNPLSLEDPVKPDGFVVCGGVCLEEGLAVFKAPAICRLKRKAPSEASLNTLELRGLLFSFYPAASTDFLRPLLLSKLSQTPLFHSLPFLNPHLIPKCYYYMIDA